MLSAGSQPPDCVNLIGSYWGSCRWYSKIVWLILSTRVSYSGFLPTFVDLLGADLECREYSVECREYSISKDLPTFAPEVSKCFEISKHLEPKCRGLETSGANVGRSFTRYLWHLTRISNVHWTGTISVNAFFRGFSQPENWDARTAIPQFFWCFVEIS